MKVNRFLGAGTAITLLLAGCESIPPGAERGPDGTMAYDVFVESVPPGANIEVNGQVIGGAPLHMKIFGDPDGTFHDFGSYYYIVRALPVSTNQYLQTRIYRTGHLMSPEDRVPQRIDFNMTQPPPPAFVSPEYPPPAYYPPPPYYYPYYYGPYYYGPSFRFYVGPPHHHF